MKGYIKLTKKEIEALADILASGKNKFASHIINKYKQNADPFKIVYTENKIDKSLYYYVQHSDNERAKKNLDELRYKHAADGLVENENKANDLSSKLTIKKELPDEVEFSSDRKSAKFFGIDLHPPIIITPAVNLLEEYCKQITNRIDNDHDEIFTYVSLFNGTISKLKKGQSIEADAPIFQDSLTQRYENFYNKLKLADERCFPLNKLRTCLKITILFLTGCIDKELLNHVQNLNLEQIQQLFKFITDKTEICNQDLMKQKYLNFFIQPTSEPADSSIIKYIENFIEKSVEKKQPSISQHPPLAREQSTRFSSSFLFTPLERSLQRKRSSSLPDTNFLKEINYIKNIIDEIKKTEVAFSNNMRSLIEALEKVRLEEKSSKLRKAYNQFLNSDQIQILTHNPFSKFLDQNSLENISELLSIFSSWDFEERIMIMLNIAKKKEMITYGPDNKQIENESNLSKLTGRNGFNIYTHDQHGLNSLLIQPVQRILRYCLFLTELLNHANAANLPKEKIKEIAEVLEVCKSYGDRCNKLINKSIKKPIKPQKNSFLFNTNAKQGLTARMSYFVSALLD